MGKRKRFYMRLAILLVLASAVAYTLYANFIVDKEKVLKGREMLHFKLNTLQGDELDTYKLEGKGIMLNFFGTYCKPCEEEMPAMNRLYEEYKNKGVEIIAINNDEAPFVVSTFVNRMNLTFPIVIDTDGDVFNRYNIGPLPTSIFINKNGEVVEIISGGLSEELIRQQLDKIAN